MSLCHVTFYHLAKIYPPGISTVKLKTLSFLKNYSLVTIVFKFVVWMYNVTDCAWLHQNAYDPPPLDATSGLIFTIPTFFPNLPLPLPIHSYSFDVLHHHQCALTPPPMFLCYSGPFTVSWYRDGEGGGQWCSAHGLSLIELFCTLNLLFYAI